jgi:hypothetical protein
MRIYSQEVADLLLGLFTIQVDCKAKACGTFVDLDSTLTDVKYVGGDTVILAACVFPSVEGGLPEDASTARQVYDVPVFAVQKIPAASQSKPWQVKQTLANLLLGKLDPWVRLQERKRDTRPAIAENVKLIAATIVGGGYDSIEELQAQGWYVVDVTVRLELGCPRT